MSVALVTGGASGIGLAAARRFKNAGWTCHLVDRAFNDEARAVGTCHEADVRDRARADAIVKQVGEIRALIACAGLSRDATIDRMDAATWQEVIDVDLTGTFNYVAACAPGFKRQGGGKIVLVSSTVAMRARRGLANYVAAKAGVAGLARAAARDLGHAGVNVNCVAPGLVDTPLTRGVAEEIRQRLRDETCLGRIAQPDDIAAVIFFLCSEDARHVTGETIRVDGGQLS